MADRRFVEDKGSRYVELQKLGTLFIPSTGTITARADAEFPTRRRVAGSVLAGLAVLSLIHAVIFTGMFALATMLAVMPVLFKQNRIPKPPPAPNNDDGLRECVEPNA